MRCFAIAMMILMSMLAQPEPRPLTPESHETPAANSYLNTSFEAEEALSKAQKHIHSGHWSTAATAFQTIGEKYGDYLIATSPDRHVNIRRHINEQIAGWPDAGLSAYRDVYGKAAEIAFEAARDQTSVDDLIAVANTYYPTRAGALALDAAAELTIEEGDFRSARQWYANLLASHPDRSESRPYWQTKLALCAAWEGNLGPLQQLSEEFPARASGPRVTWGGRERSLGDFIRDILDEFDIQNSESTKADSSSPAVFCGDSDRRAFFSTTAAPEARLWQFTHFGPNRDADNDNDDEADFHVDRRNAFSRLLQSGRLLASIPVFGHGLLYYHDAQTVWAVDPEETNKPVWRYTCSTRELREPPWISEDEPPDQFTSLLAGNRLFVHLEHRSQKADVDDSRKMSMLVCLHAETGQLIWQNKLDGVASEFENLRLDGAPMLHRHRLFAVARRRKAFGFESCLLLCLDAKTGRLRWHTHIGEAATGSYGYYRPTRTHAAGAGDLVFVHTNLGTIAAVSATTGRVVWLRSYRSKFAAEEAETAWPTRFGRPIRSWQYQPTIVWRGAIICTPLDLEEALVLEQNDGRLRQRLPMETLGNPETILGIHGDLLYAVGHQVICYDLAAEKIAWQRPLAEGQLFGRGAVTTNGLLVPTNQALLQYPLRGGAAQVYPWKLRDAGNVLPLDDQIVIASPESHYALVGKRDAFDRLIVRMKERPKDHKPALALADLAFTTGEFQRGLDAVDQAVARLGGFARIRSNQLRRRLFERLMDFSRELVERQLSDPEFQIATKEDRDQNHNAQQNPALDTAVELLEMAGRCAVDIKGQIVYRLALAKTELCRARPKQAVRAYQQILRDRSLRKLSFRIPSELYPLQLNNISESGEVQPNAAVAILIQSWIERLIAQNGRDVYAAVEQQARNRFKIARAESDLSAMLEVADAFPNSLTAVEALIAHARLATKKKNWTAAIRSYRRALTRTHDDLRPALLGEFAVSLVNAKQAERADQWLNRGIRDFPKFQFEHEGRQVAFTELRKMLLGDRRFRNVAHPLVNWPLNESYHRLFPDRVVILDPTFDYLPKTHWDAIITYANEQIEARSPTSGRSLWPLPVSCATEPILLGMDDGRYFFATAQRLFALTRTSGQLAWQFGEEPPDDPGADPESFPAWPHQALTARHLFATSELGDLVCIDRHDGNLRWRRETGGGAASHLAANDRYVFYTQWQGRRNVVHIVDADNGQSIHSVEPEEIHSWQVLIPSPIGTLLAVRSRSILSIDPNRGEISWRIDTADNFVVSTLNVDAEGLFISDDGRRIAKYDLYSGRKLWRTPPIGTDLRDGLWAELAGGRLLAASRNALMAFDSADGRGLWRVRDPPGLRLQSPVIMADSVVVISPAKPGVGEPGAVRFPALEISDARPYRVRRISLGDGEERPVAGGASLLTEPLESCGGLFARNNALLLLDGRRLIGYVGAESGE